MQRRTFIAGLGCAALMPLAARAQQAPKTWRIGFLRAAPPADRELEALLRGLSDHGYVQGRNFVLISRWGDGDVARLPELAVALVNENVDVIVTEGVVTVRAAHAVTNSIPIVTAGSADPFLAGLVKNLSRPGENVTGFSSMSVDIAGKTLGILKQLAPGLNRVAMLAPRPTWTLFAPPQDQAAKTLGINIIYIEMPRAESIDSALQEAVAAGAQAVLIRGSPFFSSAQRHLIVDAIAARRVPVVYERREYVEQGGLVSYAADSRDLHRRTAEYVTRILAGAKAGDLPIQQPSKFELIVNLKTAKAQGIAIPPTLLALADEVIE